MGNRGKRANAAGRIGAVAAILVLASCVGAFVLDRAALSQTYARVPVSQASLLPTYDVYEAAYPRTDVEFELGDFTLRGHMYGPENKRGLVIFRHGIFSQHEDYLPMITALVDKGWRVFAYDAIGCGASDGESTLGMSQSPLDVAAAIDFARESGMADGMPLALWGHSWGGYGVAAALALRPDVDACVTMSGYDTPMKVLVSSAEGAYGLAGRLQEPFLWLNTVIDFGADANRSASEAILAARVPTMIIHGIGDTVVPYANVSIIDSVQGEETGFSDPLIKLKPVMGDGRDGHNSYFYSPESQAYLNECAANLQALLDENDEDATAPEVCAFLDDVDILRANTADPALIDEIDAFLAAALS